MSDYKLPEDCPYTLKRFKEVQRLSEETLCFAADIALRGKVVGSVSNRGTGGANMVFFSTPEDHQAFQRYLKELPPDATGDYVCSVDEDYFFSILANTEGDMQFRAKESKKWIKRCQSYTIYRVVGDPPGKWQMIQTKAKKPLDLMSFQLHVASKCNVEVVLNEMIEGDPYIWLKYS